MQRVNTTVHFADEIYRRYSHRNFRASLQRNTRFYFLCFLIMRRQKQMSALCLSKPA